MSDHPKGLTSAEVALPSRAESLAKYRERMEADLIWHKARIDDGLAPRCGLRLRTSSSASVVPVNSNGGSAFACFSLDSRDPDFYAIAHEMAVALVEYADRQDGAKSAPEGITHAQLCRLSRAFHRADGVGDSDAYAINEWLKAMIAAAPSVPDAGERADA